MHTETLRQEELKELKEIKMTEAKMEKGSNEGRAQ